MCTLPEKQILSGKFRCRLAPASSRYHYWPELSPVLQMWTPRHLTQFWNIFFYLCPVLPMHSLVLLFFFKTLNTWTQLTLRVCLGSWINEPQGIQSWGNENFWHRIFVAQLLSGFILYPAKSWVPSANRKEGTFHFAGRALLQNKFWVISEDLNNIYNKSSPPTFPWNK